MMGRDLAVAFLLACISWLALTTLWAHVSPGGLTDKIIGNVLSPSYRVGKHFAHLCFPNYSSRNNIGYYFAPLFGVATDIVFLSAMWLVGIRIRRWTRLQPSDSIVP
jgi:hypothetical protein